MYVSESTVLNDLCAARRMLAAGEHREAYQRLAGPIFDGRCQPAIIAGEASSLIRDGLIGEAIDRISGFLEPNFSGRRRYAATGCEAAR